jgi:hypothetical protein
VYLGSVASSIPLLFLSSPQTAVYSLFHSEFVGIVTFLLIQFIFVHVHPLNTYHSLVGDFNVIAHERYV